MNNRNANYWQNKIAAYLDESVVKVFDIKNRKQYAKSIQDSFGAITSTADEKEIQQAQYIASGLTRAALPFDDSKLEKITLKHPLVKNQSIDFSISNVDVKKLVEEIKNQLETELSYFVKDLSEEEKYRWIFNYLFFAYNKMLRKNDVGGLGALWDILPADTRIPDHPMWHHFGMTSAIYSSLERNDDDSKENLSLVVYSITPVQDFIGKARKLRDYWTGSVLLSYLAFTGITAVMEELGPDHILYPSLQNQALVEQWLEKKNASFAKFLEEDDENLKNLNKSSQSIASFPNKFVFICNHEDIEETCKLIEERIDSEWKSTAGIVKNYLLKFAEKDKAAFRKIWDNTVDKFWKYSWAATNFATVKNESELESLLQKEKWQNEFETMKAFDEKFKTESLYPNYDASNLYGATHSLAQGLLAAGKMKPTSFKNIQKGEKCPLCGEHEVLNDSPKGLAASDYNKNITAFWNRIREESNSKGEYTQVGKNERLCAICALKRFLPLGDVFTDKSHILHKTLVESYGEDGNFPSTTEMARWEKDCNLSDEDRKKQAQKYHKNEIEAEDANESGDNTDKYYAFLLMDGDKMGDLINGETTEATWNDVINIKKKESTVFASKDFAERKRTINPALHSMISDSLNNFARYGVQPAVDSGHGKLIYAGGDDVCAILPLSTAFETADKIRKVYQLSYGEVTENGSVELKEPKPNLSKIVMHLGHSDNQNKTKISLSGAIIIAHHKQPLKEVILTAHSVLDGVAKEKSGRNSLAIRLMKRSGGDRDVWFKWEEKNVFADDEKTCRESFLDVISNAGEKLTPSLLYKIENLKGSFEPILFDIKNGKSEQKNIGESEKRMIVDLLNYEVAHSIYSRKDDASKAEELAKDLAGLCIKVKNDDGKITAAENWFNPESAIIANFMAKGGVQNGKAESEIGGEK